MSAAVQASPLNRLSANLEELGLGAIAPMVPDYVRLVADGQRDLVTAMLEMTSAQLAAKGRADDDRRIRMANFPFVKTLADFVLIQVGWMRSGLRYATSRRLCAERGHLDFRRDFLHQLTDDSAVDELCNLAKVSFFA